MIWETVAAGLPSLAVLGAGLFVAAGAAHRFGVVGNPVTAFLASWVPMGIVLATGWMTFHPLQPGFIVVLASSIAAFLAGTFALARPRPRPHPRNPLPGPPTGVDPGRFRLLLWGTALIGLASFLGFVAAVRVQLGWGALFQRPQDLRWAMGAGTFTDPTKLPHYATMLLPVLVVIGREAGVALGRGWWVGALLALGSNLFSTGRTKIVWVAVWMAFCLILSRERREPRRVWGVAAATMAFGLLAFWGMGAWLGKGFPVHEHGKWMPEMPEEFLGLGSVFFYLGTNLPYLQEVLGVGSPEPPLFSNLLLPSYKVLSVFLPGVPVPSEILETCFLPYPANTGTWLVQFAFDAGVVGVLVFPFLVGGLAAWLVTNPAWPEADPRRLYFGGLALAIIWLGFIGNKLPSTPTWLFVGFGLVCLPMVRAPGEPSSQSRRPAPPGPPTGAGSSD